MAYVLPTFNLTCNVWHNISPASVYLIPDATFGCNLAPGKRVMPAPADTTAQTLMVLLLPALSDVRANWNGVVADVVECPAGSLRFYQVHAVDDFGKGFGNEHRFALLAPIVQGVTFSTGLIPFPVPLP